MTSSFLTFSRRLLRHNLWLLIAAMALATASCSSSKSTTKSQRHTSSSTAPTTQKPHLSGLTGPESRLVAEAEKWLGTPYKYGGNTKSGVDCSGFVCNVYQSSFQIQLPRNSAKQQEYCTKVKKQELTTGDLVFFATRKGSRAVSHVGLYVGDGKMIHASSSKGVVVQDLSADYYTKAFVSAGRVESFTALNSKKGKKDKKPSKTASDKGKDTGKSNAKAAATPLPDRSAPSTPMKRDDTPTVHSSQVGAVLAASQPATRSTVPAERGAASEPVAEPAPKAKAVPKAAPVEASVPAVKEAQVMPTAPKTSPKAAPEAPAMTAAAAEASSTPTVAPATPVDPDASQAEMRSQVLSRLSGE